MLGSIKKGVTTRSQLRNFCAHNAFVSCVEPQKVFEALEDPDWLEAMHDELNNFKRNKVWSLVERPKGDHNVIGTKWIFKNKQDAHGVVIRNKQGWWHKVFPQSKVLTTVKLLPPRLALSPFVLILLMLLIITLSYIKWM